MVFKVISLDSSNSTFFKNAGLSTHSLKPPSAAEQALLEEIAAQKQKEAAIREEFAEVKKRSEAVEEALLKTQLHEEVIGREPSHPLENLASEHCWYLFSALILSLPPMLVGSELYWWCDKLSLVL